jgi:hypothetical protein
VRFAGLVAAAVVRFPTFDSSRRLGGVASIFLARPESRISSSSFGVPMFESARLKIERADHHIGDLERQLREFTRHNLDASVDYRDDGTLDIHITVLEPPPCVALILGDAVHNLRSALDHLMWEWIGLDGGQQHRQLYFPTGQDGKSYKRSCDGVDTPSAAVKDLLKSFEAFPGGAGHFLYMTHRLDNADKHTTLTPVIHAPTIAELVLVSDGGQVRRRLSDLYGNAEQLGEGETFTVDGAAAGTALDFENDAQIFSHIIFDVNVEFVRGEPIFPTILQLRHAVSNAIDIVERSAELEQLGRHLHGSQTT